jgi:hypothetical protein
MHIKQLTNRTIRRLYQIALIVLGSVSTAPSLAAPLPEGMKGWWYYTDGPTTQGYASNPVEACTLTAKNHYGTPLVDMRASGDWPFDANIVLPCSPCMQNGTVRLSFIACPDIRLNCRAFA